MSDVPHFHRIFLNQPCWVHDGYCYGPVEYTSEWGGVLCSRHMKALLLDWRYENTFWSEEELSAHLLEGYLVAHHCALAARDRLGANYQPGENSR
jgi:hypothetical protein